MSYNEPFGVNTCFCLLGWGKCCALFPAVLNILLELIPSSTNRLTSDQPERKIELPQDFQIYRSAKNVYLPTSLIYQLSPN